MLSSTKSTLLFCFLLDLINAPVALGQEDDEEAMDEQGIEEDDLSADQLRALHKLMDVDGNGKLAFQEALAFSQKVGKAIASKDVGTIMDEIDVDKNGYLSLDEHLSDIKQQADGGDEEEVKELQQRLAVETDKFKAADTNGDAHLNTEELTALFYPETHPGVLAVTTAEIMKQKDKNGDGKLTPHEFWEADVAESEDGQLSEEENADFKKLDADGDGLLDVNEMRGWESGTFHLEEAMKSMFDVADKDSDMHITADELAKAKDEISLSDAQYHLIEWAEHHEL